MPRIKFAELVRNEDEHGDNICIASERSLSLNDLLWIILAAPMDNFIKMDK